MSAQTGSNDGNGGAAVKAGDTDVVDLSITPFPDGVHNVLPTSFLGNDPDDLNDPDDDGWINEPEIDYESLRRLYRTTGAQVDGLVLLGTTSQTSTLSTDEQMAIVVMISTMNECQPPEKRKFITVGIGGNSTSDVLTNADMFAPFCDAFMVTVPHYNKPQQRGIVRMFQRVSKQHPTKPIIIYNIPSRTGTDLSPESMAQIVKTCPNVVALKEASGNWENVAKFCELIKNNRTIGDNFKIFSGDDGNISTIMNKFQGSGVISVAGNIVPFWVKKVVDGPPKGGSLQVQPMAFALNSLVNWLFIESNPVPINYALHRMGIFDHPTVREPLVELESQPPEMNNLIDHIKLCY